MDTSMSIQCCVRDANESAAAWGCSTLTQPVQPGMKHRRNSVRACPQLLYVIFWALRDSVMGSASVVLDI